MSQMCHIESAPPVLWKALSMALQRCPLQEPGAVIVLDCGEVRWTASFGAEGVRVLARLRHLGTDVTVGELAAAPVVALVDLPPHAGELLANGLNHYLARRYGVVAEA